MNRTRLAFAAILTLCLGSGVFAAPTPKLDFSAGPPHPSTASVSYDGTATGNLQVQDVNVFQVVGVETALNDGVVLSITNGILDFATGATTGITLFSGGGVRSFAGGGTISITGSIPAIGTSGTLLSGTITGATVLIDEGSNELQVTVSTFINSVDPTLASYYFAGQAATGEGFFGDLNLGFTTTILNASDGFSATGGDVGSGNIETTPVPEPGTLAMGLVGILVSMGVGRYRMARNRA